MQLSQLVEDQVRATLHGATGMTAKPVAVAVNLATAAELAVWEGVGPAPTCQVSRGAVGALYLRIIAGPEFR